MNNKEKYIKDAISVFVDITTSGKIPSQSELEVLVQQGGEYS